MAAETKAEFVKRYPKPRDTKDFRRVLASCSCEEMGCTGWVWGYRETPEFQAHFGVVDEETSSPHETEVEEPTQEEVDRA